MMVTQSRVVVVVESEWTDLRAIQKVKIFLIQNQVKCFSFLSSTLFSLKFYCLSFSLAIAKVFFLSVFDILKTKTNTWKHQPFILPLIDTSFLEPYIFLLMQSRPVL